MFCRSLADNDILGGQARESLLNLICRRGFIRKPRLEETKRESIHGVGQPHRVCHFHETKAFTINGDTRENPTGPDIGGEDFEEIFRDKLIYATGESMYGL